jgi:hypothetical protein
MPSLPITAVFVDFRYLFSSSLYRLPEATRPNGILPAPETNLMRLFFVCALCLILVGCSHPPARGIVQTCTSQGCFTRTAATTPIEPKRAAFRPRVKITTVKSKKAGMAANKPAAAKPRNPTKLVKEKANSRTIPEPEVPPAAQPSATPDPVPNNATTTIGGKTDGPKTGQPSKTSDPVLNETTAATEGKSVEPAIGQPSETSDPVLKKAKITVAAKMENPASVEFVDMKRVTKEHILGQPVQVICGHVKGKKKSGEATGERPFLYLVKEDEALIVGGNPDSMAAIAYRANCTSSNSHR